MIRAVHHVAISTPNLERLRAFYCDLFGFQEVSRTAWPEGVTMIDQVLGLPSSAASVLTMKLGAMCIELFEFTVPAPGPLDGARPVSAFGLTHICFDVDDIEGVYRRMVDAGVRFHCPPQDFGGAKATYGRDPDGNVFELQQLLAG